MSVAERYTLAQVATWELSDLSELGRGDGLIYTPQEATATAQTWAWLLGVAEPCEAFDVARKEVFSDGEIFAIMHRPATEFLGWWRLVDWSEFSRDDDCGPDSLPGAWAWALADRLRLVVGAMPASLARQLSTVAAVRRFRATVR